MSGLSEIALDTPHMARRPCLHVSMWHLRPCPIGPSPSPLFSWKFSLSTPLTRSVGLSVCLSVCLGEIGQD